MGNVSLETQWRIILKGLKLDSGENIRIVLQNSNRTNEDLNNSRRNPGYRASRLRELGELESWGEGIATGGY